MKTPIIKTERLVLRQWQESDFEVYCKMNRDARVMEHFPSLVSYEDSLAGIKRYIRSIDTLGYGYFAVEDIASGEFVGFIGMMDQTYESPYTPAVDIGWRLKPRFWGKGLATEGARAALDYAQYTCSLSGIISVATLTNTASQNIMKKLGMKKIGSFGHPKIPKESPLHQCVVYSV